MTNRFNELLNFLENSSKKENLKLSRKLLLSLLTYLPKKKKKKKNRTGGGTQNIFLLIEITYCY